MKVFQNRAVAAVLMVLAIAASVAIGQARKPDLSVEPSTKVVGSYTYTYDEAGILSDKTMEHIDAMNASLFAQTGAQIMVKTVNSTNGQDILEYAIDLGNQYGVGDAERNNGVVMVLALDNISASGLQGDYGVLSGSYDYGGRYLKAFSLDGDGTASLLLGKYRAGSTAELLTINASGELAAALPVEEQVLSLSAAGRYVGVLTADRLDIYSQDLELYNTLNGTQNAQKVLQRSDGSAMLIDSTTARLYVPQ